MSQDFEGTFAEMSRATLKRSVRILEAKFEALQSTPDSRLDRSNFVKRRRDSIDSNDSNDSDKDSVFSNMSQSSNFTNRTEEADGEELSLADKFECLVDDIVIRVTWEEFVRIIDELDVEWDKDRFRRRDFISGGEAMPYSATCGQQTLGPCPTTNEQHTFHWGMRCTLCLIQLCEVRGLYLVFSQMIGRYHQLPSFTNFRLSLCK